MRPTPTLFVLAASTVLLASCSPHATSAVDAARPMPPPTRPTDVLVTAHFGHPRATLHTVGTLSGLGGLLELGFNSQLGVDPTVLAACDLTRPMDVVVTGTVEAPDVTMVFMPGATHDFRSTLAGRYRFATVAGVGEALQPRDANARPGVRESTTSHCAIVGVPGPIPSRMVCAGSDAALLHAARWAAYLANDHAEEHADAVFELDGATVRERLVPLAHQALDSTIQQLAQGAAEARREHPGAPDYGDPETVVAMLQQLSTSFDAQFTDVRHARLRLDLAADSVVLASDLALDAHGTTALAHDAVARATASTTHALTSRLAPDAFAAFGAQAGSPAERVQTAHDAVETLLRVLGPRVSDPIAAREDLTALFAQSGTEAAVGVAREPTGSAEITALFAQADGGAAARGVIARMSHAPWLRGVHPGVATLTVAPRPGGVLLLTLPTPTPAHDAHAGTAHAGLPPSTTVRAPSAIALGVAGDALVITAGSHPDATVAAVALRAAGGPAPGVLASADAAPMSGAVDVTQGTGIDRAVVRTSYAATHDGDDATGHARIVLTPGAIALARAMGSRAISP